MYILAILPYGITAPYINKPNTNTSFPFIAVALLGSPHILQYTSNSSVNATYPILLSFHKHSL